jgi:uncharacterized membrane protein
MRPPEDAPVSVKVRMSIKSTWYGLTLIYIAVMLTLIFLARIFDWRVGG